MSLLCEHLPPGPILLDASAIINLLGCGDIAKVLQALGAPSIIEERTFKEVQRHPVPGFDHASLLEQLQQIGVIKIERMTRAEYQTYLSLVQGPIESRLDDGESAAIALTFRGYPVILDERKARSVVLKQFPHVRVCSTLRLLATAAKRGGWLLEELQQLVLSARRHARMGVPRDERHMLERLMQGADGWPLV